MTTALEQQPTNKPSRQSIDTLVALYNTGDLYRLIEDAKALLDVYPDTFVVWNILGAAAAQIGNEALAESAFEKTIEIEPGFADGHNNLGNILLQQQKCEQAVSAFQQAIKRQPDNSNTLNNLALALLQSDKPSEALPVLQSALNINPDCATSFLYLGDVYTKLNQSALAIQAFEHATAIDHKMANAFKSIGRMLCQQGDIENATNAFKKTLLLAPFNVIFHELPSSLESNEISIINELIDSKDISDEARSHLYYVKAGFYAHFNDYRTAFESYRQGAALVRRLLAYDIEHDRRVFESIQASSELLSRQRPLTIAPITSAIPIFILGMPRSGTSITEQILGNHSEIISLGELDFASRFGIELVTGVRPINEENLLHFRESYLRAVASLANNSLYVTDKMPHNFRLIALICHCIPEAKIIHLNRDPAAVCWSNFKTFFLDQQLAYSWDLHNIVEYYSMYDALLTEFKRDYADRVYELNYEILTEHPEQEIAKLLTYVGVEWQSVCLSPHNNRHSVDTASKNQVKKPIYAGSSNEWRRFLPYLDGAFDCFDK